LEQQDGVYATREPRAVGKPVAAPDFSLKRTSRLPTRLHPGDHGASPASDAVVSTRHLLNYRDTRAQIAQALAELAQAVRPGGSSRSI